MYPRRGGFRRGWGRPYRRAMWGYRRPFVGWGMPVWHFRRPFGMWRGGCCGIFALMFSAFVLLGVLTLVIR